MSVYYRFKSSTELKSILIDGPFITVGALKEEIKSKKLEKAAARAKFDLVIMNPLTNEDYIDEDVIHRCATVLIRRVPQQILLPIVVSPVRKPGDNRAENESSDVQTRKTEEDSSAIMYPEELEWHEFAKDWCPRSDADSFQGKSTVGNSVTAAAIGGGGLGRNSVAPPPPGYVCHRCKIPGHFIKNCPTNSDRSYDVKRLKRPTGIPKSMLMNSTDGSYALPGGASAIMNPNEAAFEREMESMPSNKSPLVDLPPELHCPLCKHAMKDAVFTSHCCFESFCDKCIREHIITKSMCVCGATEVLADHLLPNKTLRDTINRMLESDYSSSSGRSSGRNSQIQHTESSNTSHPGQAPSSTLAYPVAVAVASKRDQVPPPTQEETLKVVEKGEAVSAPQTTVKRMRLAKDRCVSEAKNDLGSVVPLTKKVVQQKVVSDWGFADAELQWRPENYTMSIAPVPPTYNHPYWTGMNSLMAPYNVGFGQFGGVFPNHPFGEEQASRKPQMKRKRVSERCGESQKLPQEQDCSSMYA